MTIGTQQPASYAHGTGGAPLLGETIGHNLERTTARVPDAEALISSHQGARFTWAEFNAAVDRLACGLLGLGLEKGDRLGVWARTATSGRSCSTRPPRRRDPRQRQPRVPHVGARVRAAPVGLPRARGRAGVQGRRLQGDGRRGPRRASRARAHVFLDSPEWEALAGAAPDEADLRARMDELDFDDPINIQYTSGTTGSPKGATLTHHNILNNALLLSGILGYTEADRVCIPVPLYHCFGMVLGQPGLQPERAPDRLPGRGLPPAGHAQGRRRGALHSLYGVPTMFIAELDHPEFAEFDLSSLRTGIMAGSPCPIEVMRRVGSEMGIAEMTIAFGMTETSPASTMVRRDDTLEHRCGTVGQPMPHTEIKIVDPRPSGRWPRGEPGEFRTRGYLVMSGYWDEPERTAEAIDAAGWMHTGDLATMDEDGYVRIVGRIKDMIIRGGENIYPREIEEFLYGHPDVADVQVIGVPDERYGEELMAWVVTREGATIDEETLRDYCRGKIAHYKVPRYIQLHRLPDDRHRQDAEVQDAREGDRSARTGRRRRSLATFGGDGLEDQVGHPGRLLVECEVAGIGDLDQADQRALLEAAALVRAKPDVVVFPERDPRPHPRVTQARHERPVTIEVLEVGAGQPADDARVVLLQLRHQGSVAVGGQLSLQRRTERLEHRCEREVPEHATEAVEQAGHDRLVLAGEARREQHQRTAEVPGGRHLECDVGTEAVADHHIAAGLRRELARELRVALDARVVRRRCAGVAR